jgi:CubicO group peptidase (beta-lactamase class C family)
MTSTYEPVDPDELGVKSDALADLIGRAHRDVDEGLLPSCQLAMARNGRLVANLTIGDADEHTRYVAFSCTKALVAGAAWLLMSDGLLDVDQRVADIVPGFGANGKDAITVEQLLTHTSGFPRAPLGPPDWADRDARLERFSRWRLNWEPGTRFEYHPTSAHWVLAEVIERVSGTDYRRFISERVLEPLGLRGLRVGVPEGEQTGIATIVLVGDAPSAEEMEAATGIAGLDLGEVTDEALLGLNDPAARAVGVPGGGGVGTAADLALYYQALLHNPDELWDPAVLADGTGTIRTRLPDPMIGVAANRSLGLVIAGDDGFAHLRTGFGRSVSPQAFGHGGAGGQVAWADPATGLSFAYLTNGLDAHLLRQGRRMVALSSRAAVCASPI